MFQWVELPALFTVARARVKAEKGGIAVGVCNVGEVAMGVGCKLRLAMFAARGALRSFFCLALLLSVGVGVRGQGTEPSLKLTFLFRGLGNQDRLTFCEGGSAAAIYVGFTIPPGAGAPTFTWTANGGPLGSEGSWDVSQWRLGVTPSPGSASVTYHVEASYTYVGLPKSEHRDFTVHVIQKPVLNLAPAFVAGGVKLICGNPENVALEVNGAGYTDDWNVTDATNSVYHFSQGVFTYRGAGAQSVAPPLEPFGFSVKHVNNADCNTDFSASVKVFKPEEINVNLNGNFCAGAFPLRGSFDGQPSSGTYSISLEKGGAVVSGWPKSLNDAKNQAIAVDGSYILRTNYAYGMDGTSEQCASAEVTNAFRVVAVPPLPEWEDAASSPLSVCEAVEAKIVAMAAPADGIVYAYALQPSLPPLEKEWKKGEPPVPFALKEAGTYTVGLSLKEVQQCPTVLQTAVPLTIKMQAELVGVGNKILTDKLCSDASQSLVSGERKIGYDELKQTDGGAAPLGYNCRWVRVGGVSGPETAASGAALTLTFKNDGTGSGQQNGLNPVKGENQYVLQYKLAAAQNGCWKPVGEPFSVNVTAKLSANKIKSNSDGVCNGVKVKIENDELSGGDGNFTALWIKDGAVSSAGGVDSSRYAGDVSPGRYLREITSGGCRTRSNELTIAQLADPTFTLDREDPRCQGVSDGEISVKATSPTGVNIAFSYDGGKSFEAFSPAGTSLSKGGFKHGDHFTVVAKTEKGCVSPQSKEVSFAVPDFSIGAQSQTAACWGNPVNVELSWSGGAFRAGDAYYVAVRPENGVGDPPVSAGAATTYTKVGLTKGKYVATVHFPTQTGGCSAETEFEVKEPAPVAPVAFDALCPGGMDGMIRATVENGVGARYILEKDSLGIWPVVQGNYDGVFVGLPAGRYRVRVSLPGCDAPLKEVEIKQESFNLVLQPSSASVRCPGDAVEFIEARATPATSSFTSYIWRYQVGSGSSSYIATKGMKLFDAAVGKYSLTVVREDGCAMTSDELEIAGPLPFEWTASPTVLPAKCKDYEGKVESKGTVVLHGVSGGANPQAWWLTMPNAAEIGQPVKFNHQYAMRSGIWKVRVRDDNGCTAELPVEVKYKPENSVTFALRRDKMGELLCFGERVQGVYIEPDAASQSNMDASVPPEITLERVYDGVLLVDTLTRDAAQGRYSSTRGLEFTATLRAKVQSEAGCRSEVTEEVSVLPPLKLQFDQLRSDVNVFFQQEIVDEKRSWRDANGNLKYRVLKDSIVAGVLADVPRNVGVRVDYFPSRVAGLVYTTEPEGLFTASADQSGLFELALSSEAMERYRSQGKVQSVRFGRKPLDVLKTTIRVADPQTSCAESIDIYVRLIRELSIPNVFTPNGDGVNDRWLSNNDPAYQTIFSKLTTLLPNIEVEVFNRAGARVWNAKGEKVAEGWDGTAGGVYGGAELPVGTYYYVIRFNIEGKTSWKPISGSVTIVR